jgi:hypothetical protein
MVLFLFCNKLMDNGFFFLQFQGSVIGAFLDGAAAGIVVRLLAPALFARATSAAANVSVRQPFSD